MHDLRFVAGKFRTELRAACPSVKSNDAEWIIGCFVTELELLQRELEFTKAREKLMIETVHPLLSSEQKLAVRRVMEADLLNWAKRGSSKGSDTE